MEIREFVVATPTDFAAVIVDILARVPAPRSHAFCITLTGDLGAGKTTFTQQLAQHLGITDHVTSPTFGIMKGYELPDQHIFERLIHIDAYRIEDIAEAGPLRLEEVFNDPNNIVCLEWPEKIAEILPADRVEVTIKIGEGEERVVTVQ